MSALDELSVQCEQRGWRVALIGGNLFGRRELLLTALEVRGVRIAGERERLAYSAIASIDDVDQACVDVAMSLEREGRIT